MGSEIDNILSLYNTLDGAFKNVELDVDYLMSLISGPEFSGDGEYKYRFVYLTQNSINGAVYVGQHSTNNIQDGYLGSGKILKESIKKYGKDNFSTSVIEYCHSKEELNNREEYWVDYFKKRCEKKEVRCYNIANGGNYWINKEIIAKGVKTKRERFSKGEITPWNKGKSNIYTQRQILNLSNKAKERRHSEETKRKIGEAGRGRKFSKETIEKRKLSRKPQVFTEEQRKAISESMKKFNSENKFKCEYCGKACILVTYKGYHGEKCSKNPKLEKIVCPHCNKEGVSKGSMNKYHFDNCVKNPKNKDRLDDLLRERSKGVVCRKVKQIDPETNEAVKVWDSIQEANKSISRGNVSSACQRGHKTDGYYWEYLNKK